MIENKMMPQYLHHLYRHDISDSFYLCVLKVPSANIRHISQGLKHEVAPPLMVCLNTGIFWTTTPQNDRHISVLKGKLKNFHPKCAESLWKPRVNFQPQKNSRRFAPVQGFCGFAAGHGPGCEKRAQPRFGSRNANKFVPWNPRKLARKIKGRFSWMFWVLERFPCWVHPPVKKVLGCST